MGRVTVLRCSSVFVPVLRLLLLGTVVGSSARADDVEVDADTTLQAYDVQSPGTSVLWARRRLTQTLGLRYVVPLAEAEPGRTTPASIGVHVRLRLNRDFGDTCLIDDPTCVNVMNAARRGSYTPLANNGFLDAPLAYVEARDLPYGLSARAGRQLHHDVVGLARVDGLSARVEPSRLFALQAIAGTLVRRESVAGSDVFVPEGLPRLSLEQRERERAPYIEPPTTSWLAGASLELGDERIVRGSVALRTLREDDDWIQRRVGAGLVSRPLAPLRLSTHAVFDTIDPALIDAEAGAEAWLAPYRAELTLERHVPRFDPSSIWAFFDVAPIWIASAGATRTLTDAWSVSTTLRGRRTELRDQAEHDVGLELGTTLSAARGTLALSGFGWSPLDSEASSDEAQSGALWGASASGSYRATLALTLEAELSVMRLDDPLRRVMRGVSFFELLGGRVAITEESSLLLALSHAHSGPIGQRLSLLAFLHLGAWR